MIVDSAENKQNILTRFLEICQLDGWNEETLEKSLSFNQIDPKLKNLIFENGCLDLIEFYIGEYNKKLANEISKIDNFLTLKIREKITLLLVTRFEIEKNNQLALKRLRNFYLKHGFSALKQSFIIADFMWKNISDQSTDFNFYTKRLTLAKIIIRSFLVFLNDKSSDLEKTKNFITLQIEGVMRFEKFKFKIKKTSSDLKTKICNLITDKNGDLKNPQKIAKELIKNLPFVRLWM
jgi:ubiquinone biosynthesis protein COQ9